MSRLPQVIAVDLDKTLTLETAWHPEDVVKGQPNQKIIDWVNEQYKTNFIVIYTARRHSLYQETVKWLSAHNVSYHAIRMEKMPADRYVDDLAIRPEEL